MANIRRISRKYYFRQIVSCMLVYFMFFNPAVMAEVVYTSTDVGTITVTPLGGGTTQSMTATNGSIGTFSDFDILAGHTVNCVQGSSAYNALFKVNSADGTQIYGIFNSDGNIYLQDLRGILIGSGGQINTNQFIASSVNIKNSDWQEFINDVTIQLKFEKLTGDPTGIVDNQGTINAASSVYLIGSQVLNSGTITAPDLLVMAAGDKVFLTHEGSKVLIKVPTDLMTPDPAINKVDIDAASTITAGQVVLAAGDIFSAALDVGSLAATANRDITLEDTITTTGDITLVAGDDVDAQGLTAGGTVEISASDTTITLHDDVTAAVDIFLNNNTVADAGVTLDAGQDVVLADGKTLDGDGALTIEGDRDVVLGGDVTAAGNLILKADADTINLETGSDTGGLMKAKANLETTAGGDMDIYGYSIVLEGDSVDAASDLTLHNNVWAADNLILKAGNNVDSKANLTAWGNLTIEATGGGITADYIDMDADDTTLSLKQNDKLDMEESVSVDNRPNTHLVAESTGDSVTSIAAAKWKDITATAYENIILSDESGNITTKSLTTETGDIKVTAEDGKVSVYGPIAAGQDVIITATDEGLDGSEDAIFLYGWCEGGRSIVAGRDIWLNNNTWAAANYLLDAGQDVRLGWQGQQDPWDPTPGYYAPKTLTGAGSLTIEANRHITLGGDVAAGTAVAGNLILKADAGTVPPGAGVGDMIAYGTITNLGGSIDIYSSDSTTELHDNVTASVDIKLHNNTWVADDKKLDAGQDVIVGDGTANGKTLTGEGTLTVEADRDIILGGAVVASDSSPGNLILKADADTVPPGAGVGDMIAYGTITNLGGSIDIYSSDTTTFLHDDVTASVDIKLHNNTWAEDEVVIDAGQDVIVGDGTGDGTTLTGAGDLTVEADRDITLGGAVVASDTSAGNLILKADADTVDDPVLPIGDYVGNMTAHSTITNTANGGGSIDIYSSDGTTYLHDDVTASVDILLHNNTEVWADKTLDAGRDVVVDDGKMLGGQGNLTVKADNDITLGGATETVGYLYLQADEDLDGVGDLLAKASVTSGGRLEAYGNNVTFEGPVSSTSWMRLKADSTLDGSGDLLARDSVTSGLQLEALGNNVTFEGPVSSTLAMVLKADSTEDGIGDLWAKDSVTVTDIGSGGYLQAYGNNVTFDGSVSSATGMWLIADSTIFGTDGSGDLLAKASVTSGTSLEAYGNNVTFEGPVESTTSYMLLKADSYFDGTGDLLAEDSITSGDSLRAYGNNITFEGPVSSTDFMTLQADSTGDGTGSVDVYGLDAGGDIDIHASDNTINIHKSADPLATADVHSDYDIKLWNDTVADDGVIIYAGDDVVLSSGKTITGNGNLDIEAADDIMFGVYILNHEVTDPPEGSSSGSSGDVSAAGNLILTAGDDIYARGELSTSNGGNITATAVDDIRLYNTATSADADGTLTLTADSDDNQKGNLTVDGALYGNMTLSGYDVTVYGDVESDGTLDVDADNDIALKANVSSVDEMTMDAGSDIELNANSGNTSSESTITLNAGDNITIGIPASGEGNVTADGHMDIFAGTDSEDNVKVFGKLTTTNGGNIDVTAGGDIRLYGSFVDSEYESAQADGDLTLDAEDDLDVLGDLISNNGSIVLSSDNSTTYLGGDVTAAIDVTLNNNTEFDGFGDQKVDAQTGTITANGWLWKDSCWGSLYLEAAGDISLADEVGAWWGGVSIISEEGKIFTPGGLDDTLNVAISGYSDDEMGDGVDLLHGPGLAAIVISSAEDLKLGPDAALIAEGVYDDTGIVDDREGVNFLDEPLTAIGGIIRDEGEPIDVAIYLESTEGDVDVSSQQVMIGSFELDQYEREVFIPQGTMVIDAFDTVTLGDLTSEPVIHTLNGTSDVPEGRIWSVDRLEVVSRLTEWLFEASIYGTLPHPYNPEIVEAFIGGDYILRGAGLRNPLITDGRAWVLEDPIPAPPLYTEAGEASDEEGFGEGGCPALMNWLAAEIGVPEDEIQVIVEGAFALSTDIQPCEMCARLLAASNTMQDPDGTQIAAMAQVVNEFVTTPAPPSPEQMTAIAAALAEHVDDGTFYASAGQWIDALVAYVGIMNTEMGYSASDAAAFAEKYVTTVADAGNAALTAYVQTRLAALGG